MEVTLSGSFFSLCFVRGPSRPTEEGSGRATLTSVSLV